MPRGGARPGAGRKPNGYIVKEKAYPKDKPLPPTLESQVAQVLRSGGTSEDVRRLAHKVAYVEQELEFIKKIILAEVGGKPKC
jgi:hypothetical protein